MIELGGETREISVVLLVVYVWRQGPAMIESEGQTREISVVLLVVHVWRG